MNLGTADEREHASLPFFSLWGEGSLNMIFSRTIHLVVNFIFNFSLPLNSIPYYICTIISSAVHLLEDI